MVVQAPKMTANSSTDCDDNFTEQLVAWHQAWCHPPPPTRQAPGAGENDENSEKEGTTAAVAPAVALPQDPLLSARIWIKQHSPAWLQDTTRLDAVLKQLMFATSTSTPPTRPVLISLRGDKECNDDETEHPFVPTPTKTISLRHLEWQVVLLLELRVQCGGSVPLFFQHFAKQVLLVLQELQENERRGEKRKMKKKKRKRANKRKQSSHSPTWSSSPAPPDEETYMNYLMEQLTRIAFLLPSNEPFGLFLTQKFLTKYMWKRIPKMVSTLLDYFEVDNPYVPRPNNEDDDVEEKSKPRKKAKRANEKVVAAPPPATAPRRPLLSSSGRNTIHNKRVNHFHGMLTDVEKLFDHEEQHPSSSSKTHTSNTNSSKSKNKNKNGKTTSNDPKKSMASSFIPLESAGPTTDDGSNNVTLTNSIITPHQGRASAPLSTAENTARKSPKFSSTTTSTSKSDNSNNSKLDSIINCATNARVVTAKKVTADTFYSSTTSTLSPVPTRQRPLAVAETPLPTKNSRRAAAETPATANQQRWAATAVIGETPASHHYRTGRDAMALETPFHQQEDDSFHDDEDRIVFSSPPASPSAFDDELSLSSSNQQQQRTKNQDIVRPMKLFGALQPINKRKKATLSQSLSVPKLSKGERGHQQGGGKSSSSQRPTNLAVAAARSFLRRKSM